LKKKVYNNFNLKKTLQPAINMSKRRFEDLHEEDLHSDSQPNKKMFNFDDLPYVEETGFWNVKVPINDSPNKVKEIIENVEFDNTVSSFADLSCSQKKQSPSDECTENPYMSWCIDFEDNQVSSVESQLTDDTDPFTQLVTFEDLKDALFLFL